MKKSHLFLIIVAVLIIGWFFVRFLFGGNEDSWIKDSRGVWVKHGNPSETPDSVNEQQVAILCAENLYESFTILTVEISSQCLGTCGDYAFDIVHAPRTEEDNLIENQCEDYRSGNVSHFIELDKEGNVVRIV